MPKIHFNGKTYNDLAEMPAREREMYDQLMSVMVDEDGDGVPDIFEGDVVGNIIDLMKASGYEDQGTAALESMSPAMRARLSKGVTKLYEWGLLSEMPDLPREWKSPPSWENSEIRPSRPIIQSPSAIQEESGGSRLLITVLVLVGLIGCGMAVLLLFSSGIGL